MRKPRLNCLVGLVVASTTVGQGSRVRLPGWAKCYYFLKGPARHTLLIPLQLLYIHITEPFFSFSKISPLLNIKNWPIGSWCDVNRIPTYRTELDRRNILSKGSHLAIGKLIEAFTWKLHYGCELVTSLPLNFSISGPLWNLSPLLGETPSVPSNWSSFSCQTYVYYVGIVCILMISRVVYWCRFFKIFSCSRA